MLGGLRAQRGRGPLGLAACACEGEPGCRPGAPCRVYMGQFRSVCCSITAAGCTLSTSVFRFWQPPGRPQWGPLENPLFRLCSVPPAVGMWKRRWLRAMIPGHPRGTPRPGATAASGQAGAGWGWRYRHSAPNACALRAHVHIAQLPQRHLHIHSPVVLDIPHLFNVRSQCFGVLVPQRRQAGT